MLAHRVVEHLDVIEHILPCLLARFVCASPDALKLEQVEEALDHGIIVAVSKAQIGYKRRPGSSGGKSAMMPIPDELASSSQFTRSCCANTYARKERGVPH